MNQVEVKIRNQAVDKYSDLRRYERRFQVNTLESDVLKMLGLVRSLKNSFAPINRIPPEILSLIPDYYDEHDAD